MHIHLETGDVPMFHNGRTLGSIGEMCKHLRFDTSLPVLDRTAHAQKLVNFQGQFVLDFSVPRPTLDWENDEDLTKALELPLRESSISDRTTRSVPRALRGVHPQGTPRARSSHPRSHAGLEGKRRSL